MNTENELKGKLQEIKQDQWNILLMLSNGNDRNILIEAIYDNGLIYPFDWVKWEEGINFIEEEQKNYEDKDLMFLIKLLTYHVRKDRFNEGWFDQMLANKTIFQIITTIKKNL